MADPHIDPGNVPGATAHPPAHDARQLPDAVHLTDEGASSVPLARVLPFFPPGAEEAWVEQELLTKPGLTELLLALAVGHDGDVHLLEDVLIGARHSELVLAPATDPAPVVREVLGDNRTVTDWIKSLQYLEHVGEADGGDVWVLLEVKDAVQLDHSNVVVEVTSVELWVILDIEHIHLHIGVGLRVAVNVPLAQSHPELLRSELVDAVSGREEVTGVYQGRPAGVDVVVLILL